MLHQFMAWYYLVHYVPACRRQFDGDRPECRVGNGESIKFTRSTVREPEDLLIMFVVTGVHRLTGERIRSRGAVCQVRRSLRSSSGVPEVWRSGNSIQRKQSDVEYLFIEDSRTTVGDVWRVCARCLFSLDSRPNDRRWKRVPRPQPG